MLEIMEQYFREGQLPEILAMISVDRLTPIPTLVLMALLSMGMLFAADVYVLINYLAFAETAVVAMAVAGLLRLRWSRANMKRPIKVGSSRICNPCVRSPF